MSPASGLGYAATPITKAPNWHQWVVWDVLFNNISTGTFLAAAAAELALPGTLGPVSRLSYPVAFLFLIGDLICLIFDLGDPSRFHHMLRVFKPSSPMSFGTWCLTAYSFPASIAALLSLAATPGTPLDLWRRVAVALAVLPAFATAVYKGVLFSTTAQPGWKDCRWLGAYFSNSAVTLGSWTLLVLATVAGYERAAHGLRPVVLVLTLSNAVPHAMVVRIFQPIILRLYGRARLTALGALWIAFGFVIPVALLFLGGLACVLAGFALILIAAWLIRSEIVSMPHKIAVEPLGGVTRG